MHVCIHTYIHTYVHTYIHKEFKRRTKKIWTSELNAKNKIIAHNTFAVSMVTPMIGTLNWTKDDIQSVDIMTRKQITTTGGFHHASDINRLYAKRSDGGRGLKNIEDSYELRMVSLSDHIIDKAQTHELLSKVKQHEEQRILRLGCEFRERLETEQSTNIKNNAKKEHEEKWKNKVTHGYLQKKIDQDPAIDTDTTNKWLDQRFSAHIEGFICVTQEQELNTKATRKRREKDQAKKQSMDIRCRVCKEKEESVYHPIGSWPVLAPSMYLRMRHNQVTRILYQELLQKPTTESRPPEVTVTDKLELWYDKEDVRTVSRVEENRPDLILWDKEDKTCKIIEVTVPLDSNISAAYMQKESKYIPLIQNLSQLYNQYKYEAVTIVIGAMGAVPKSINQNIEKLSKYINKEKRKTLIPRIQKAALLGTVKILKTVLKM